MTIARGPYQILTILDKHRQSSPNAVTAQPKRRLEGLRRTTHPPSTRATRRAVPTDTDSQAESSSRPAAGASLSLENKVARRGRARADRPHTSHAHAGAPVDSINVQAEPHVPLVERESQHDR